MIRHVLRSLFATIASYYASLGHLRDPPIALLSVVHLLDGASRTIMVPLLPAYAARTGADPLLIGALFAAPSVTKALCATPFGALSDRTGRRPWIVAGTLLGGASVAGLAFSFDPLVLLALRGLDGVGAAASGPATMAYLGDYATADDRGSILGAARSVGMLAVAVGPAFGGLLATAAGLRVPFVVLGALTVLGGGVLILADLPAPKPNGAGETDTHDSTEDDHLLARPSTSTAAALATVPLLAAGANALLSAVGNGIVSPLLAPLLEATVAAGPGYVGLVWSFVGVGMVVSFPVGGTLADRMGRLPLVVGGKVVWAAVAVGFVVLQVPLVPPLLGLAGGLASGLTSPALSALNYEVSPSGHKGAGMGAISVAHSAGDSLGPFAGGLLASVQGTGFTVASSGLCWLAAGGLLVVGVGGRTLPGDADAERPSPASE